MIIFLCRKDNLDENLRGTELHTRLKKELYLWIHLHLKLFGDQTNIAVRDYVSIKDNLFSTYRMYVTTVNPWLELLKHYRRVLRSR